MADRKNGTDEGIHNAIGEEPGAVISSPVDCWELVSSPLPEAVVDGPALEAAIAAGCSPGDSLHDDYFVCPRNSYEHNVLPLSTMMAAKLSKQGTHSSNRSDDAHVSLGNENEGIAIRDEGHEDCSNAHGNDFVLPGEDMHLDGSKCHDDNPFCMFLDEDAAGFEHRRREDVNPVMCNREMMEHDDILPAGNNTDNDGSTSSEEDNLQAHPSISVVEFTAGSSNGHELSTLAATQDSELASTFHGLLDKSMEIPGTSAEGGNAPAALGGVSRESSGQVEDSTNLQGSLASTCNLKAFTCVSWLWTQFCRWQAQLGYANTIWSMTLAAAVMGIIVVGRRWQRLQAQNYSLRSQLWAKEKRITQLMFQLLQTKEALAKTRRVPVICVKPALQIPKG
ncbi:hypothetical protein L7F22_060533 [Adiantum nelumboides]|nr:hypothetical protein [Adiantum nelumboides]